MSGKGPKGAEQLLSKSPQCDQNSSQHEFEATVILKKKLYLVGVPSLGKRITSILIDPTNSLGRVTFLTSNNSYMDISTGRVNQGLELQSAVRHAIGNMPLISGVAQMRVTIGSFIFDQYRRPKNTQDGYTMDEFEQMLSHEMSKGHMAPGLGISESLLLKRLKASELFMTDESGQMYETTTRSSVKIELVPIGNTFNHLELDFQVVGKHFEKTSSRWVQSQMGRQLAENKTLLQAVMLNPNGADWELKVREKTLLDPKQLSSSTRELQHEIRFGDGTVHEPLLTQPKRRTTIPKKYPISRLTEKSAVQFPIVGTEYILEIARYDVYCPKRTKTRAAASPYLDFQPPSSFWEAIILGRTWDDDMGTVRSFTHQPNLTSDAIFNLLFKRRPGETQITALQHFIMVVTNVAGLWGHTGANHMQPVNLPPSQPQESVVSAVPAAEGTLIDLD